MSAPIRVVWFREDLRLRDHPALTAAARDGGPVLPVFVHSPDMGGPSRAASPSAVPHATGPRGGPAGGAAARWWLHHALAALDADLRRLGSHLLLRTGPEVETLAALARAVGAREIYWNRRREPGASRSDESTRKALEREGLVAHLLPPTLLLVPEEPRTGAGGPYRVFTPYYRAVLAGYRHQAPLAAPRRLPAPARWPRGLRLAELGLLPTTDWSDGIRRFWAHPGIGERAAHARLRAFTKGGSADYETARDRPDLDGTSRLSPHLHFGEISPRQVWDAVGRRAQAGTRRRGGEATRAFDSADAFLRQIVWREFAHHVLHHFPEMPERPRRPEYARMPWRRSRADLRAWQRGETGYPIVDAAMRQLWETGWMHNRARMIVASFLVKDLLLPWQAGARWFMDTLVDADWANNAFGWQWAAGCGADAAPFFRIFNPVLQGRKFDPDGAYVRRYVPALRSVPVRWVHAPWEAPDAELLRAGIRLGRDYPRPIVDHAAARRRALAALARTRRG